MTQELEELQRTLGLFSATLSAHFAPICRQARLAVMAFGSEWQGFAEQVYLQHHRRLPGSMRTCRLKKKRCTKVFVWFEGYIAKKRTGGPAVTPRLKANPR